MNHVLTVFAMLRLEYHATRYARIASLNLAPTHSTALLRWA